MTKIEVTKPFGRQCEFFVDTNRSLDGMYKTFRSEGLKQRTSELLSLLLERKKLNKVKIKEYTSRTKNGAVFTYGLN